MVAAVNESFYQNVRGGEMTSTCYDRCRRSARLPQHILFAQRTAEVLAPYQPEGEANDIEAALATALLCATATEHGTLHFEFMAKLQFGDIDEVASKAFFKSGGKVRKLLDGMDATLAACRRDHIFLDLTDDINNGTSKVLDMVASYQTVHAVTSIDECDAESEGDGSVDGAMPTP